MPDYRYISWGRCSRDWAVSALSEMRRRARGYAPALAIVEALDLLDAAGRQADSEGQRREFALACSHIVLAFAATVASIEVGP